MNYEFPNKNIPRYCLLAFFCHSFFITCACKCVPASFSQGSDNADLIFQGKAVTRIDSLEIGKVFYTFQITKTWKGENLREVTIKTSYGGPACGAFFELGKKYVVFSKNLQTFSCDRNAKLSECTDVARLNFRYSSSYREQIGTDSSSLLSQIESEYFNIVFNHTPSPYHRFTDSLDFTNQNLIFLITTM